MDTSVEPVCPSCRAGWNREFLATQLTATFLNGPFKTYREKVLVDRERARLPEAQEQATNYKKALDVLKPIDAEIETLNTSIKALRSRKVYIDAEKAYDVCLSQRPLQRVGQTWMEYNAIFDAWKNLPETLAVFDAWKKARHDYYKEETPLSTRIHELNKQAYKQRRIYRSGGILPVRAPRAPRAPRGPRGPHDPTSGQAPEPTNYVYVHKCPTTACEGFLNKDWTCGLCETVVCKDCREPTSDTHTCNEDTVKSIKAMARDAKPCPNCAAQISRISGCNQMWCTQCRTGFNYATGQITRAAVTHNPHYFDYMNRHGAPAQAPNPLLPIPCGDGAHVETRIISLRTPASATTVDRLLNFLQLLRHLQHVEIPERQQILRTYEPDEWRRKLRVSFMAQEITEAQWKAELQKKEKENFKVRSHIQMLEMYTTAGMDIMLQVMTNPNLGTILGQLDTLLEFTETAAAATAKAYKCVPIKVNPATRIVETNGHRRVVGNGTGFGRRRAY